ncbi:MAG: hypothetical protein CL470_08555 [Acidimicrobiaceae bacterium]|nr:hypothetical protein [Acidimicrobiaceae bacterium]|tara:strand:+ start:2509 stop:3462 length:954 start_codon:yes stop_codon:yes gene_type:complete
MKIIHIGLPKTGTTFLQNNIFPSICKIKNINYGKFNEEISEKVKNHVISMYFNDQVSKINLPDKILVSNENLLCNFPTFTKIEEYADKNLVAFGKDCKIVITIRHPVEYLSSVYNQVLKSHITEPEFFFLEKNVYSKNFSSPWFSLDDYNLSKIIKIYKDRFDQVITIKFEEIIDNSFLKKYFEIDSALINKNDYKNSAKSLNRGFSKKSVSILLSTQKILNKLGYSLNSSRYHEVLIKIKRQNNFSNNIKENIILKKEEKKNILRKIFKIIISNINIRSFLKNKMDKYFFKEKFVLDFKKLNYINLENLINDYKNL